MTCNVLPLRPALSFWRSAYAAGVRITHIGGEYQFTKALSYWQRIQMFGAFGIFPPSEVVVPPSWIREGVARHDANLRMLLCQPFPPAYQRFAAHALILDYEVRPIEQHAKRNGDKVVGRLPQLVAMGIIHNSSGADGSEYRVSENQP